ncbi:MAG: S8 family serine peptidase, partial [Myxococcota bacterium]
MITALLLVALAFPLAPVRERWVVGLPRNSAAAMEIRSALERYPVAGRLPFAWAVDLSPEELAQVRSFSVRYLEKDQPLTVSKRQTADCFGEQWTLRPVDGFPPSATMDIESAWEVVTGDRSVRIAVVDDGVEAEHPELAGRVVGAVNLSDDGLPPGALSLRDDHGTQTAGIIGAARDGIGITGVCPDCALLSVRLLGDGGPDDLYQTSSFAAASAISWAVENGAAVINNSWGPPDGNPFSPNAPRSSYALPLALDDAIDFAVTEGRSGLGTVLVWSAGNGGEPIAYDAFARDPRVLAVGSIDFTGRRAVYSDWGSALDLMTPSSGESGDPAVFATDRLGALGDSARNDVACADADACSEVCLEDFTREFGGTSASAAHVAGIAGLIASRYPELTAAQIIESMLLSAIPVDGLGASGVPSPRYGYGRVDPAAALAEAGAALSGRTRFF